MAHQTTDVPLRKVELAGKLSNHFWEDLERMSALMGLLEG